MKGAAMAYTGDSERPETRPPGTRRTWQVIFIVLAVVAVAAAAAWLFNMQRTSQMQAAQAQSDAAYAAASAPGGDPAAQTVVYGNDTLSPSSGSLDAGG